MAIVFNGRLTDHDRLKAALKRRVLFNMLSVLIERCRANAPSTPPCKRGLNMFDALHRALSGPGSNEGMQLVNE